jgi:hypothetical protein
MHCQKVGKYAGKCWKTLEKREAMLEKRKDVESHAWGDLKCDRAVMLGR